MNDHRKYRMVLVIFTLVLIFVLNECDSERWVAYKPFIDNREEMRNHFFEHLNDLQKWNGTDVVNNKKACKLVLCASYSGIDDFVRNYESKKKCSVPSNGMKRIERYRNHTPFSEHVNADLIICNCDIHDENMRFYLAKNSKPNSYFKIRMYRTPLGRTSFYYYVVDYYRFFFLRSEATVAPV